jgi:Putative collagen-binding domain of a collagenase
VCLITNALGANDHIQATRGKDYLFIYSSQGKSITVNTSKISGREVIAYWYNPRKGESTEIGTFAKKDNQEFIPPTTGYGQDWVLVIDDASKNYSKPGAR